MHLFILALLLLSLLLITRVRNFFITFLKPLEHLLWGNIKDEELLKFIYLSLIVATITTCTWGLKTLKDSLLTDFVGRGSLAHAKIASISLIIPVVFLYNFFANKISLESIFTFICSIYSALFIITGTLYFIATTNPELLTSLSIPQATVGWLAYLGTESFSSLLVSHYFVYLASINTTDSAKRGYGLIIFATQLGNLIGPTIVVNTLSLVGFSNLLFGFSLLILTIPLFIKLFTNNIPRHLRASDTPEEKISKTHNPLEEKSFFQGVSLLYQNPYLMGLATITTLHEVISSMLDLQFKIQVNEYYTGIDYATYMGSFAQMNAVLGILFGFFGTSFLLRKMELRSCLILYPLLLAVIVWIIWIIPSIQIFFAGMIAIKTLGYTLNRPIQEIMFIPTSNAVKTQTKSIIDSIGKRGGKALGASIVQTLSTISENLLTSTTYTSLALLTGWVLIAVKTGTKYKKLIKNKIIVG
jgi:ATP/ADP translocase